MSFSLFQEKWIYVSSLFAPTTGRFNILCNKLFPYCKDSYLSQLIDEIIILQYYENNCLLRNSKVITYRVMKCLVQDIFRTRILSGEIRWFRLKVDVKWTSLIRRVLTHGWKPWIWFNRGRSRFCQKRNWFDRTRRIAIAPAWQVRHWFSLWKRGLLNV